jgi:hypothetical protein
MCELQLTVGIMSCTALLTTLCVKGGTHPTFLLVAVWYRPVRVVWIVACVSPASWVSLCQLNPRRPHPAGELNSLETLYVAGGHHR